MAEVDDGDFGHSSVVVVERVMDLSGRFALVTRRMKGGEWNVVDSISTDQVHSTYLSRSASCKPSLP